MDDIEHVETRSPFGHPPRREPDRPWGPDVTGETLYGDWQGVPRPARTRTGGFPVPPPPPAAHAPRPEAPAAPERDTDGGRDALTGTGAHRRIPAPRPAPGTDRAPVVDRPAPDTGGPDTGTGLAAPVAPPTGRGVKFRTYTGMAAAVLTTALAVVVAGQVTGEETARLSGQENAAGESPASAAADAPASAVPSRAPAPAPTPPSYEQQMAASQPIDPKLTATGEFDTVPGTDKAPGKGTVVRYRVDVERGLGLDPELFARAVQTTLNDPRSWGEGGKRTFERVSDSSAEFAVTLASPGTTGVWCKKSGLDIAIDNVSCDSASTERVMINAYRWAQGSPTFGPDAMFAYRQMLINHEVGHRLGHGHESCRTPGTLAPVMQQQTKTLDLDGIKCLPNPWPHPQD
ncbi:DUF3152 domain-containing protein [Streptomyces sp. BI20]|uniref:DUF3152 domain-containing protein n=1 Tax=Streptomyces sp. BI20 TaxID=3403460 RepID=UPI003C784DCB